MQTKDAGDISLDAIAIMAQAQDGETYLNCINCYPRPYKCSNDIETYRCRLGGTKGCNVNGQIPC